MLVDEHPNRGEDQSAAMGQTLRCLAHDLRGPLGVIQQVVDILRDGDDIGMTQEELYEMLDDGVNTANQRIAEYLEKYRKTP